MTPGLTSILIPTYNHAQYLPAAIESALAQTAPVDVLVIDDGSTDDTATVLERYRDQVRVLVLSHRGPSAARNAGLDAATGEFVMFLDADDVIAPAKVERQLREFTPDVGWVLCDVLIEDEGKARQELASARYDYGRKELGGWIARLLEPGNFIPIMSPLLRRSVIDRIRFADTQDGTPEDWRFWQQVAGVARVRYLPEVLATYRKKKTGRNRLPKAARAVVPNIVEPLRLNLGCGTPGTRSWHPIDGFVNLDKALDWRFEDGLGQFADHSVAGITISHALMYLEERHWPAFLSECSRVLVEGGVLRITEDETQNPASRRYGGWKGSDPAMTLTSPAMVRAYLERAGLMAYEVTGEKSHYRDGSLRQSQHGDPPNVFFMEGVKLPGTLFAPHSDDETLFAAFTILRYRPRVVVCFGSAGDYGTTAVREAETREAMTVLGAAAVEQWHGGDLEAQMRAFDARVHPVRVWAPDLNTSHPDHVAVARAAAAVFAGRLTTYHTYRDGAKVRHGQPVAFEPEWVEQKLRAMLRYTTQLRHPRAHVFFTQGLDEFYGTVSA